MMPSFKPIHRFSGAKVGDIDLTRPLAGAVFAEIQVAYKRYLLLVFSNQTLGDNQNIAFSRRLGPLGMTKVGAMGEGTELVILTNIDPHDGAITPPDHQVAPRQQSVAHGLFVQKNPAAALLLSARIVSSVGVGTEFASMRVAYVGLDDEMKQGVEGRVAMHSFANSRNQIDAELVTSVEQDELPPVPHPLVLTNPATAEKSFYVASHASQVVDMPVDEGKALMASLMEATVAPGIVFRHVWRDNDFLLWDNRRMLHRGQPLDNRKCRRNMIRTTVLAE